MSMSDLRRAIENEHPCEENACDVASAMRHGCYLWAARLLMSATECPETDKAFADLNPSESDLDAECALLLEQPHADCPECNSIVWTEHDTICSNCHHEIKIKVESE